VITLVALTAVAWTIVGIRGVMLHEPYPRNTLFFKPEVRFSDFLDLSERVPHMGEPHVLSRTDIKTTFLYPNPYPYPAASFYVFIFFVRLFPNPLAAYLTFVLLAFFTATGFLSLHVHRLTPRKLPQVAVWATLLLNFPLMFLLDRGNIEAVIWVFILLGIVAYTRNRFQISAIVWAVAASMKIFPGLLFVLFLVKRKYAMFALAVAATVAFAVLALAGIGPTIREAAADSAKSAPFLTNTYIVARMAPEFDHSLLAGTKQVIHVYDFLFERSSVGLDPNQAATRRTTREQRIFKKMLPLYTFLIPLGAFLLYWFRLRHMPILNQFITYMILCILLPYVSGDYTLVHVSLVWGAFLLFLLKDVATGAVAIPGKAIVIMLFSCAVTFVPLSYLVLVRNFGQVFGLGAQAKTVFLALILWTVLRTPMPSSLFGDLRNLPGDPLPEPSSN
jgi:hypothetical protein